MDSEDEEEEETYDIEHSLENDVVFQSLLIVPNSFRGRKSMFESLSGPGLHQGAPIGSRSEAEEASGSRNEEHEQDDHYYYEHANGDDDDGEHREREYREGGDDDRFYNQSYDRCMSLASIDNALSEAFMNDNPDIRVPYMPESIIKRNRARRARMRADGYRGGMSCVLCEYMCIPRDSFVHIHPLTITIYTLFYEVRFQSKEDFIMKVEKLWNEYLQKHIPDRSMADAYNISYSAIEDHFFNRCMVDSAQRVHDELERIDDIMHVLMPQLLQQEVVGGEISSTIHINDAAMRHFLSLSKEKLKYITALDLFTRQACVVSAGNFKQAPLTTKDAKRFSQPSAFNQYASSFFTKSQGACDVI